LWRTLNLLVVCAILIQKFSSPTTSFFEFSFCLLPKFGRKGSHYEKGNVMEPTNNDRARWANDALETMAIETGSQQEFIEEKVSDLLCNLRHLCDAEGLNFNKVDARARINHAEERRLQRRADVHYAT
jgi:hypothetical protein